jgi:hypothetical protein
MRANPRPRVDGRCGRSFECHWSGEGSAVNHSMPAASSPPDDPERHSLGPRVDCEQVDVEAALVGSHLHGLA